MVNSCRISAPMLEMAKYMDLWLATSAAGFEITPFLLGVTSSNLIWGPWEVPSKESSYS